MKSYNIKYKKESKELIAICLECSLDMIKSDIHNMGGTILSIETKNHLVPKKDINPVIIEKNEYYISRYNFFYKKHKNSKITTEVYNDIKKKLKDLKEEVDNKIEFQEKFEEYLKTNHILEKKIKNSK